MAKARGISKHTPIYIKRDIDTFLETKIADKKSGIVFVHGQGGLGKSTLLQSIKNFTTAQKTPMIFIDLKEPKDTNMVSLLLDKSITTIDNCPKFENIRKLIEDKPELFADILERYDKESSGAIENSKKVDESYGVAMQTVFDILKVGAKFFKNNSEKAYKEITDYTDFILIGALSDDFKPHGVFIVDTFEKIKNIDIISKIVFLPNGEIDKSIQERHYRLKDYIEGLIYLMSEHTTFVIAGRNKIDDLSMDLPHEDVEEIGMDKFTTENIKEYFTISKVSLPNDEMIEYIHNITNGNALLISLFPKIHKDFDSDWGKLDKEEIERVMLEDEEHGLLFYLTDRVFSHIDKSLEIYKLVIPRVLNRGIERILYSDIKVFDEMVESGLMYKGRGRSFERFELHDSVKSAIKANNKRTMGLHFSSHHDDPKISTIHTQMIEYYQTHRLEKNINKDLEICYHSMLLRKDFERNFDKDREEFVELVFGSLYLNTDDKNNICKNFDGFISEQISKLISVFYKDRDRLLNMISPQLYSRLKLETERGMEDVLRDIRFLISLTKERAFKNDSSLYYLIGEIYCEKDEYDKAIEFYSQAIELNPKYDSAYYDMGNAYYNLKEYDNAITAYQKAIDINLKYADVYNNMGLAYDELKEYDNAIEAYQKAIDINTQDYKAYSNMGLTYYNLKEYDKAIEAYQKAIEINPKFTEVSCHMGNAYDKLKEYDKAIKAYQKAIKINPKNDYAYYNMGNAYDKLKEYDKAITAYEKAIEINPKERVAYTNLFELELMRNQDFSFEEHFLGYCGEDKDAMMRYQMLKILQMIATNKPYDLTAELWSEKYRDIELNWGWDEINGWLENMPDGEIKAKLVEEIEVFKAHKRY